MLANTDTEVFLTRDLFVTCRWDARSFWDDQLKNECQLAVKSAKIKRLNLGMGKHQQDFTIFCDTGNTSVMSQHFPKNCKN